MDACSCGDGLGNRKVCMPSYMYYSVDMGPRFQGKKTGSSLACMLHAAMYSQKVESFTLI